MKNREGVASVVGTILAMLVFLSLLGIFVNHYVPSMMTGNEHHHDSQVVTQISDMKQSIDSMMLYYINSQSNTLSSYSPVTLGSAGVPMFATGTQGQLGVIPVSGIQEPSFSASFSYNQSGSVHNINSVSGGGVVVNIPNRYYIPQSVLYENDAVILGQQSGGQVMLANPGFTISNKSGISLNLLQMSVVTPTSSNITFSGTNTVGLNSQLLAFTQNTYTLGTLGKGGPLKITIITPFATAWESFFNSTFAQAGLQPNNYHIYSNETSFQNYMLTATFNSVRQVTLSTAIVSISVEE
jgi:hypothetical protein